MSSGGKREGAGRKCDGSMRKRSLTIRIEPQYYEALEQKAKERGLSKGKLVEYLITAANFVE